MYFAETVALPLVIVPRIASSGTHTMGDASTAVASDEADLGLPGWLNDMLKPGVGQGVFTTLKLCLIGLVLTLCVLLIYIEDEARMPSAPAHRARACGSHARLVRAAADGAPAPQNLLRHVGRADGAGVLVHRRAAGGGAGAAQGGGEQAEMSGAPRPLAPCRAISSAFAPARKGT